ncbi:efflux RND transporter periplasmic adaptor subunit [Virgibacillus sp. SK37]|uniref:efflux RND transporter periplasmic adaptor subunit n=1 Tax=Virgibacillus sp. SK37 TaxID=403957 RepID=UPI0004D106F3|nr:efflux RND transporter periplasmic adaptor subunit [Virgibacillus sp. SK37]AIF44634.1 hypothetical protein X953_17120 [Virgibacillus sp. SK37]
MKKLRLGTLILLTFAIIGLLAACNDEDESKSDEKEKVTPVEVTEAVKKDMVIEKMLYGRTSPNSTSPVMVQVPGEVDELEVRNGDMVEEDDLIAKISTPQGKQNIRAPRDGEVASLSVSEGETTSTEEPLAVITDMDPMKVKVTVTADARSLFKLEDTVKVMIDEEEYDAEVTSIGSLPDDTGLYPVQVSIENEDEKILPGMVAEVHITEKKVEGALTVPTSAIVEESDASFVYIVKDNKAGKKKVEIVETQSDHTAIKGDVKAGDKVVVSGQLTLSDGNQVKVSKGE